MCPLLVQPKKIRHSIYYNKMKTSNLIISNNSSPSSELLDRTNDRAYAQMSLGRLFFQQK